MRALTLRIAGTVAESIVDGPGFRYTLFTQGCPHACPGCHNPQTHAFEAGQERGIAEILSEIEKNPYVRGVTFSGGEPFCQPEPLYELACAIRETGRNIIAYTGYTFEQLMQMQEPYVKRLLSQLDLLIDGRYEESLRSIDLNFRGSANQRILDVPKSLAEGKAIWDLRYKEAPCAL